MSITFQPAPVMENDRVVEWAPDEYSLNVSNGNARLILAQIGVEFDYAGSIDPVDLCVKMLASDPIDSGTITVTEKGNGPTMIDCGLRPGYFQDVFAVLWQIAHYAAKKNLKVQWC